MLEGIARQRAALEPIANGLANKVAEELKLNIVACFTLVIEEYKAKASFILQEQLVGHKLRMLYDKYHNQIKITISENKLTIEKISPMITGDEITIPPQKWQDTTYNKPYWIACTYTPNYYTPETKIKSYGLTNPESIKEIVQQLKEWLN